MAASAAATIISKHVGRQDTDRPCNASRKWWHDAGDDVGERLGGDDGDVSPDGQDCSTHRRGSDEGSDCLGEDGHFVVICCGLVGKVGEGE